MPPPKPKFDHKPQSWFKESPNSRQIVRDDPFFDLASSIRQHGIIQPIGAADDGERLYGARRFYAGIEAGLEVFPVLIFPGNLTVTDRRVINLTENVQRLDLSPPETYLSASELLRLNEGWTRKDLAEHLGKSQATITQWLSPDDLIPEARQAFLDGKFGFTKSYAIAKLPQDQQGGLLALTLSGATRDHLERQGRRTRAAGTAAVRASKLVICLANEVKVTVSGCELSLDEAIDAVKDAQREMTRGRDQGLDMRTLAAVTRDKAKAGA